MIPYPRSLSAILSKTDFDKAVSEIRTWPGYKPTALISLDNLAVRTGVKSILYKNEADRFGLGSFKALGGAYAVLRKLQNKVEEEIGRSCKSAELIEGLYQRVTRSLTVCTATDGNHGRSVAWGAKTFGCKAVIYVHATVSEQRCKAIQRLGATIIRHPGNYDETVHRCARDAQSQGWTVVSDTSYEGYEDIPRSVMAGYGLIVDEALDQMAEHERPTHVFVQSGVGGLAAAVCSRFWLRLGKLRPKLVVVEPINAACFLESRRAGRRTSIKGDLETVMAGLSCGETSIHAWSILKDGAEAFMTISDDSTVKVIRLLADGSTGDPPLVAGESAVAGLAGFLVAKSSREFAKGISLGKNSRVLVLGTEGATDESIFIKIVGRAPDAIVKASRKVDG